MTKKLKDSIQELYQDIWKYSEQKNLQETQPYLAVIKEIIDKGPSYLRQRAWKKQQSTDYRHIVENLLRETRENIFVE